MKSRVYALLSGWGIISLNNYSELATVGHICTPKGIFPSTFCPALTCFFWAWSKTNKVHWRFSIQFERLWIRPFTLFAKKFAEHNGDHGNLHAGLNEVNALCDREKGVSLLFFFPFLFFFKLLDSLSETGGPVFLSDSSLSVAVEAQVQCLGACAAEQQQRASSCGCQAP